MARKAYFEKFYEKVCEASVGDNERNGYDLVFDFEEALTSYKWCCF